MILDRFSEVETFIFDVDGVLTNGSVIATDAGEMQRTFNIKDGFALQFAVKAGYTIIIISGGDSEGVRTRLKALGIQQVHTAVADKRALLTKLEKENGINLATSLYMGDDLPDVSVMNMCGLKTCPKDAVWEIQDQCDWVSQEGGGQGAVREIIEKVLTLQDKWESSEHSVW